MDVFVTIISKLVPLYILIGLGIFAVRVLKTQKESIGNLIIYTITPVIVFYGTVTARISAATLTLPLVFFICAALISLSFWKAARSLMHRQDGTENILGFAAGNTNSGYFCLPVALMILGNDALSPVVLGSLGFILYENSLGFYILARAHYSVKDSLKKLARLPSIYAFLLGLLLNLFNFKLPSIFVPLLESFKGAYSVLGMMIIGMGLARITLSAIDRQFIGTAFLAKFIVWPLLIGGLIYLDTTVTHIYDPLTHKVMLLLATAPLAANTVTFATIFKVHPERAAVAVFLSTMAALVVTPLVAALFM